MRRILGGLSVAMGVAVTAAIGQTVLGRELRVLILDQEYAAGNDTWPFQLVLVTWFIANAVVLGCAAASRLAAKARWRHVLAAAAGVAALAPIGAVRGWAGGATSVADPVLAATLAVLAGAVVGAVAGSAVLVWRGVRRNAAIWAAWVWSAILVRVMTDDYRVVATADPLGLPLVQPLWRSEITAWLATLSPVLLCALLGWWGRRRGDRHPVLAAVFGPLVLIAAYVVVLELPGSRIDGDHYSLDVDLTVWLFITALGSGAAALGGWRWRGSRARHRGRATAASLLMVTAGLLAAAALMMMWQSGGGWWQAAAAAFAFATALASRAEAPPEEGMQADAEAPPDAESNTAGTQPDAEASQAGAVSARGASVPWAAGAAVAAGGVIAITVLGIPFTGLPAPAVLPSMAVALIVSAIIGALARGVAGAAWFALAAGVLQLAQSPLSHGLILAIIVVLAVAAAVAALAATQRHVPRG